MSLKIMTDEDFEAACMSADTGMAPDPAPDPRELAVITEEIQFYKMTAGTAIIEIGPFPLLYQV